MSKKFFTQLSAAALLFCVASSGIQATELKSTDSEKKLITAVAEEKPAVQLPDSSILIKEIVVSSGVKRREVSPLRLVDIDEQTIAVKAAGKTYPELLQDIPGIYATAETGSYGDAKINIRGFKQETFLCSLTVFQYRALPAAACTGTTGWALQMQQPQSRYRKVWEEAC